MLKNKQHIRTYISLAFLGFIVWVIYMANTAQSNFIFSYVRTTPYGDKIGHFFLFGLLTLVINYGLKFRVGFTKHILLGTQLVFIFVCAEELSQYYIPSRTFDLVDLMADILGIGLFNLIALKIKKYSLKCKDTL